MHLEILVEDQSGMEVLKTLVPKVIGEGHTFKVHSYRGVGRIPKGLEKTPDPGKRQLLNQLSQLQNPGIGRKEGAGREKSAAYSTYVSIFSCPGTKHQA